jgi:DNA helicase-2/ATP-dependent DNA helicase PcrA
VDKRIIFAVAGSGKTTLILSRLDLEKRALVITYTVNNVENLRKGIIGKFGYFPGNIKLLSYFNFLYGFCYRPFLGFQLKARGINWNPNPNHYAKDDARYIDGFKRLYSNRIAKLLEKREIIEDIKTRITKYFDDVFFDEIQDFAGNDFNLLKNISCAQANILFVGDFFQHTFDTSRDGTVNASLHNEYANYRKQFKRMGLIVDTDSLVKSHRCSPTICRFISERIGIQMESHRCDETSVEVIYDPTTALDIYNNESIVKLFYNDRRKYSCLSKNWGECKGEDHYQDVCVVLNKKSWQSLQKDELPLLPASTKNKFYVACSRAKRHLYLVSEEYYKTFKERPV